MSRFYGWKPETVKIARGLLRRSAQIEQADKIGPGYAITAALDEQWPKDAAGRADPLRSRCERIARLALKATREPRSCSKAADLITADLKRRGLK